jgi:Fanconi anemia group M protein
VAEALSRLRSAGEISEVLGRFVPAGVGVARLPGLRTHLFEVEKVLAGRAVLVVDGKWRSVLVPQEYTGPRDLIKRGARFQAMAELYRYEGKLHARIHAVERVLS